MDTTAPGVPKSVVSETYPENLPGGAVGERGRFDVDTGVDDARDVEYRIGPADTDDDGNSGNTSTEGWQRTPTTNNGFAAKTSFYAAPAEDGNHQAEVRSVDRADNTGATRVYGFASPRRTDTGVPRRSTSTFPSRTSARPLPDLMMSRSPRGIGPPCSKTTWSGTAGRRCIAAPVRRAVQR
ncbi:MULTISPECIES: hypothetical protein [Streptomyces]|uniref:hypothetical protein n=1 Tax=Streptomyces TaxID=1883 RepID=UPI001B32E17D|nr:hypothetical protein [Streptomyces sp. AgN23]QTI88107.1 hypothetical protein AS97_45520 [Streptomyces sp. AgN23]